MARRGIFLVPAGADPDLTLVHVDDVVHAIVIAASSGKVLGDTFFIGHADPVKGSDVLRALAATEHRAFRPIRIPRAVFGALAWLGDVAWKYGAAPLVDSSRLRELRSEGFVCSVERARDLLGFTAQIGMLDGLAQTGRWYADAGWL
jgi:nucleoside-diphosphate-sugar epimerase